MASRNVSKSEGKKRGGAGVGVAVDKKQKKTASDSKQSSKRIKTDANGSTNKNNNNINSRELFEEQLRLLSGDESYFAFSCGGSAPQLPTTGTISVDGVDGALSFPLKEPQIQALTKLAKQPRKSFFRDAEKRRTWKLRPTQVHFDASSNYERGLYLLYLSSSSSDGDPQYSSQQHHKTELHNLVASVGERLGYSPEGVKAVFKKMVLYEQSDSRQYSSFHKLKRDKKDKSGKKNADEDVFALLVVQLPSLYSGGKLKVETLARKRTANYDFGVGTDSGKAM